MKHIKFVVLSQPRTGSTLLCSLLSSHPGVRCLIEPINPSGHSHHMQPIIGSHLVPELLVQEHLADAIDILLSPKVLPNRWMLSKKAGSVASGFKIMAHQIRALKQETVFWDYLKTHDIKVVVVFRHNIVLQYISDLIVKKTRQPACWDGNPLSAKVEVPIDSLWQNLRRIMHEKRYILGKCESLHYKKLSYEQFSASPKPVERILEWLIGEKCGVTSPLRKQNPDGLRLRVTNYHELVKELEKLGFGHLLYGT